MFRKALTVVVLAAGGVACTIRPADEDYPAKIAAIRAAKDDSFKNGSDSPVPADKKAALLPLQYFPIDESYAVPASLDRDITVAFDAPSGPVTMRGDAVSLREAFKNVVENAIQHGAHSLLRLVVPSGTRRGIRSQGSLLSVGART